MRALVITRKAVKLHLTGSFAVHGTPSPWEMFLRRLCRPCPSVMIDCGVHGSFCRSTAGTGNFGPLTDPPDQESCGGERRDHRNSHVHVERAMDGRCNGNCGCLGPHACDDSNRIIADIQGFSDIFRGVKEEERVPRSRFKGSHRNKPQTR